MLHLIFSPIRMVITGVVGLVILLVCIRQFGCREIFTTQSDIGTEHEFSWGRVFRNYIGLFVLCLIINIVTAFI